MAINYESALNAPGWRIDQTYDFRDTILYALSIGLGQDPLNEQELKFLYEKNLLTLPTLASSLAWKRIADVEIGLTYAKMVHSEQRMTIHRPVPIGGEVYSELKVKDVVDRGPEKGALVYFERTLREKNVEAPISTQILGILGRADGGFGGPKRPMLPIHPAPERKPDLVCPLQTSPRSALIYRLMGDFNPLHIEPAAAQKAGFPRPILHGLATYGLCGFAILKSVLDYDPSRLIELDGRMSAPVMPGDLLETDLWVDGDTVSFKVRVPARDVVVFNNGRARIRTL